MYGALDHVYADRQIESINTLIIGELCTDKTLEGFCQLDGSLKIMLPNRSLLSSKQIFFHLTSVLREGGNVIILDKGCSNGVSCYDYPFLSQISRLELKMTDECKKRNYPILYAPWQSIKLLLGLGSSRVQNVNCPDEEIIEVCKRKNFHLIYLRIK